ncbi:MAG: hypothetical protein KC503_02180, partial [Myxococcales bacterium]|nr:hypothetical protein [Myxococcales bacterium]
ASRESLRRHAPALPVTILCFGDIDLGDLEAEVERRGSYEHSLDEHAATLGGYPVLHKWIGLAQIAAAPHEQLLYLDNDTYICADLDPLFTAHAEHDFYAREEPFTMRSPHGYDPEYVDELALASLAYGQGCKAIPPYNLGVVLLNNGLCGRLGAVLPDLLAFAARFAQGTLPYPSSNRWIIEQVALWLSLGRIEGLTHGLLDRSLVAQDDEFLATSSAAVVHYFSRNTDAFLGSTDAPGAA